MNKQFDVNTGNLKQTADDYQKIYKSMESYSQFMQNISNQMSMYSYGNVRNSLSKVIQENNSNTRKMRKMGNSLTSIALKYEQTEKRIVNRTDMNGGSESGHKLVINEEAREIFEQTSKILGPGGENSFGKFDIEDLLLLMPVITGINGMPLVLPKLFECYTGYEDVKNAESKSISYKEWKSKNGISSGAFLTAEGEAGLEKWRAHAEGSAAILKGKIGKEGKYAAGTVEAAFLAVQGKANIGIPESFSMGNEESKTAGFELEASAAVLRGETEGRLGLEDMNVHGEAEGALVGAGAEAEAGLVMGDGNIALKAEASAEAYLAKGEVSGGVTILGIDIDLKAEGMVGVQAEAGAEVGLKGFNFNLGLGPVGFDIAIDWSDFDLIFWD